MKDNWQLIETAPTGDWQRVLLGWRTGQVRIGRRQGDGWAIEVESILQPPQPPPTHWQPLIAPELIETPLIADPPKLVAVPFLGRWRRDGEHETRLAISVPEAGVGIDVKFPWMSATRTLMLRWLVEALKMWPHPDAPVLPDEVDYPAFRHAAYTRLFSDGQQKDAHSK